MEAKADPRARSMVLALLVLSPLVMLGAQMLPPRSQSWQAAPLAQPGCVCPPGAAAQASSRSNMADNNVAALMQRVRRLPWRPWLTQAEARRGVTYSGSGAAMRRLAGKLLAGQPVSIVAIGGSVTASGGLDAHGQSYIARVFQYMNSTFPHSQHVVHNEGVPAWSSGTFEPCLEAIVPRDADLVVVEFAVNDYAAPDYSYTSKARRCYEQLLRRLLRWPSQPTVLLLQYYPWWRSLGDGILDGLYYREPETEMTVLGQYYDLPVVSLRAAAWRLMQAGIEGLKVEKVTSVQGLKSLGNASHIVPRADPAEKDSFFYGDGMHPDLSKLRVLAELVIHPLAAAVEEVAAGVTVEERQDARLHGLPPPMIPGVQDSAASSCYMLEGFKPVVKDAHGFEYRPERPAAPTFVLQKWGWSGLQPGDWAELEVDTQLTGATSIKQRAVVGLMHLGSYEGMGTANITCISGCTCNSTQVNAVEAGWVSRIKTHAVPVTPHPYCRIRVEIVGERKPATQRKFMLSALTVQPEE